jgi:hypothetical protein
VPVGSGSAALLVQQGGGTVLLNNTDLNNTVWLADDPFDLAAADSTSSSPLPPLGFAAFDGTSPVWGICPIGQTALVSKYPGGGSFFQLVELLVKTIVINASAGNGLFIYSGTGSPGNPPVLWAVPPGATTDPYANTVAAILGIGNPAGARTQIDATGDITLTGPGNSQLALQPAAALPFSLTAALAGIMQTLIALGSGDTNQAQAGVVSGITLGTGSAAKMGTLITSPYGATSGMGLLLEAENDGATDVPYGTFGTVTTQSGTLTFTPLLAILPGALIVYTGASTLTVVTKTSGSGTIPIPATVSVGYGESWGHAGNGGTGNNNFGGGGGGAGSYGADPLLALTPGGTAAYSVPAHGAGNTTLAGAAVTVTGNAGNDGAANGVKGTGGAASANTIAFKGGDGGTGASLGGGGGGGGGAGPGGAGGNGGNGTSSAGGAAGTPASGGGAGGKGGNGPVPVGAAGVAPAGAGGGNVINQGGAAGLGASGQVRLTMSTGVPAVALSFVAAGGPSQDQFGTALASGMRVVGADTNTYRTERLIATYTGAPITVNSLTAAPITNLAAPLGIGTYRIYGKVRALQGGVNAVQAIQLLAAGGLVASLVAVDCVSTNFGSLTTDISNVQVASAFATDLPTGAAMTNGFSWMFWFDGIIVVSTAGTLQIAARCVTLAADTWTVRAGSYLRIEPA